MASPRAPVWLGATSSPVRPSSTISGIPPEWLATTRSPQASPVPLDKRNQRSQRIPTEAVEVEGLRLDPPTLSERVDHDQDLFLERSELEREVEPHRVDDPSQLHLTSRPASGFVRDRCQSAQRPSAAANRVRAGRPCGDRPHDGLRRRFTSPRCGRARPRTLAAIHETFLSQSFPSSRSPSPTGALAQKHHQKRHRQRQEPRQGGASPRARSPPPRAARNTRRGAKATSRERLESA